MLVAQQLLVETAEVDAQIVFLGERSRRPAESRELFGGRMALGLGETVERAVLWENAQRVLS